MPKNKKIIVRFPKNGKRFRRAFIDQNKAELFYLRKWHELFGSDEPPKLTRKFVGFFQYVDGYGSLPTDYEHEWPQGAREKVERERLFESYECGDCDDSLQIMYPGDPDEVQCVECKGWHDDKGRGWCCDCKNKPSLLTYKVPKDSHHHASRIPDLIKRARLMLNY